MRRGQTNIVSMLLITGILVVAITSAYFWGFPLLQKNQDSSRISRAVESLTEIADSIEIVARDKVSRSIPLSAKGELRVNDKSIEYITVSDSAYTYLQKWIVINEDDFQGVPEILEDGFGLIGKDKPAILLARSTPTEQKITNEFRIITRELEDVNSQLGTRIVFEAKGESAVPSGDYKIVLNYEGDETASKGSITGGDLRTTTISVRIV